MQMNTDTVIRFGLAIILLLCLLNMPYGYYQLVRVVSFVGFVYLGIRNYHLKLYELVAAFSIGVILFNPFFTIVLGRLIWNIVDVIYAGLLFYSIYKTKAFSKADKE